MKLVWCVWGFFGVGHLRTKKFTNNLVSFTQMSINTILLEVWPVLAIGTRLAPTCLSLLLALLIGLSPSLTSCCRIRALVCPH